MKNRIVFPFSRQRLSLAVFLGSTSAVACTGSIAVEPAGHGGSSGVSAQMSATGTGLAMTTSSGGGGISATDSSTSNTSSGPTTTSGLMTTSAAGTSTAAEVGVTTGSGGGPHHLAPNGYYVVGNTVFDAADTPHLFHGVARPSFEWTPLGEHVNAADFQLMSGWGARVVRIALNQDFWLSGAPSYSGEYASNIDTAVNEAHAAGLDVILDLHWSDQGDFTIKSAQQAMADTNSVTFWSEVATRYKGDGRVLFELYNEPHDVPWDVWLSGGPSTANGFQVAGMQQLYDTVRGVGADNLVIVGGLNWAFDLSGVPDHRVQGYNILYASHPYANVHAPSDWAAGFGNLAATDPVILTEFGSVDCTTSYDTQLIQTADMENISWTSWAWYPGGCSFPSLITNWTGAPSEQGLVVQAALLGYP